MSVPQEDFSWANPAPFDDDSPEYVVPIADGFADYLKIPRLDLNQLQSTQHQSSESAITRPYTEARFARFSKWIRSWFGLGDG